MLNAKIHQGPKWRGPVLKDDSRATHTNRQELMHPYSDLMVDYAEISVMTLVFSITSILSLWWMNVVFYENIPIFMRSRQKNVVVLSEKKRLPRSISRSSWELFINWGNFVKKPPHMIVFF